MPELMETATSPMGTPEHLKHEDYNMRAERAEKLLNLVRRVKPSDLRLSTRTKTMAVLQRKLLNQLRVPTSANPSFHLYREVDLLTAQAAKSVFFDLKKKGPFLRGKIVYYNFETDSNSVMKEWFALEKRRENGVGQAMLRNHGQVLVMARPPFLVEHMTHDEAEGLKMTCGLMTLNCRGVPRFAPPPPPDEDTPQLAKQRAELADQDLAFAWGLIQQLAQRGECELDRNWFFCLRERFGPTWLSYLSDCEGQDSESAGELSPSEEEED